MFYTTWSYRWKERSAFGLKIFMAELIGTGFLTFFGCMACVKSMDADNRTTDIHAALTFGLVVAAIISIFWHISAAHLNPAVTAALYILGQISSPMVLVYLAGEMIGSILGYGLLLLVTPEPYTNSGLCITKPQQDVTIVQAMIIEFVITGFVVLLVCALNDPLQAERQDSAPLKFGALIIAATLASAKFTGAGMNPARSLGPAVWTGEWDSHWIYWFSPIAAGICVSLFYKVLFLSKGNDNENY